MDEDGKGIDALLVSSYRRDAEEIVHLEDRYRYIHRPNEIEERDRIEKVRSRRNHRREGEKLKKREEEEGPPPPPKKVIKMQIK